MRPATSSATSWSRIGSLIAASSIGYLVPAASSRSNALGLSAHRRRESGAKPQQPEIVHIHLGTRRLDAVARGDAEAAMMVGGVDQDVDASADLAGGVLDRARVGQVERQQRDLRDRCQAIEAR